MFDPPSFKRKKVVGNIDINVTPIDEDVQNLVARSSDGDVVSSGLAEAAAGQPRRSSWFS